MFLVIPALASVASGTDFFVSTIGSSVANGSIDDPWDLSTAFSHPAAVAPGDRIWIEGGTYPLAETLTSNLNGSDGLPIYVRAKPGERVTFDCAPAVAATPGSECLDLKGSHTWYWGLELTNTSTERSTVVSGGTPNLRGIGINSSAGPGTKLINMVVHDVGTSIFESQPSGLEIYGLIAYNSGWDAPDRSHGPGIYIRNRSDWPVKTIRDSVVFQHYRQGLQGFGSFSNVFSNFHVEGNVFFNNGIGADGLHRNIMFGNSNSDHVNNTFRANYSYYPTAGGPGTNMFGGDGGCSNLTLEDNVFSHGTNRLAIELNDCVNAQVSGNAFYGSTLPKVGGAVQSDAEFRSTFPANEYFSDTLGAPSGIQVFVRPNRFEGGRAHIVIYNWDLSNAVDVDVSSLGLLDDDVTLRNIQDYYGATQALAVNAGTLSVPMQGWTTAIPIGYTLGSLPATLPQFGVFVVEWDVTRSTPYRARP